MWGNYYKSNKYGNAKVTVEGITFDSKREARRYLDLLLLEKAGDISDLQRQVKYVLIPAQREPDIIGPKGGRKPGKVIEKEVSYIADFRYKDKEGNTIVEDAKGYKDGSAYAIFSIKRKMMLYFHHIRIREV